VATFPAGKELTSKFRIPVAALDLLLAAQANGERVRFLNINDKFLDAGGRLTDAFVSDGIHLNAKGYKVWAEAIDPTVRAMLGSGPVPPVPPAPPVTDGRTRWVHADGELVQTSTGVWVEKLGTGEFHFVETARTAEFVQLFDKSRDYTLRLTATAMLIKGGNATVPKFADFEKQRDGRFAVGPAPVVGGPRRLQWKHADGYVQYEYSGKWSEKIGGVVIRFVEKSRTADFVELFDKNRDYTLRLTASAMLIKGGNATVTAKFPDFTPIRSGAWVAEFPVIELGFLSEKEESGGRGPGTVSSGVGDPGGVSYGTYQLSSTLGRADAFVKRFYPTEFKGLKGGTPAFSTKWRELAKKDPVGLHKNEHAFIKETHQDIQARKVLSEVGLDVGARSRVVQDVVWSVAVQHGPATTLIVNALKPLVKTRPIAGLSDEELVRAIYTERSRKNAAGKLVYAAKLNDALTASLVARFARERREALTALDSK
jgi:hypothetical protein